MRVAIDCTSAVRQAAGIGRYTRGLVSALADLAAADGGPEITPLFAADAAPPANLFAGAVVTRARILPLSERALTIAWHRLRLPLWADVLAGGADLFHSPDFTLPPLLRARGVLTVHDLTFLHYPEHAPRDLVDYLSRVVPRSVRRARVVLADSESTRADLMQRWGTPADKVRVVYAGVGPTFAPVSDAAARAAVCSRYCVDLPFVLTVGTLQPRKNHLRLVQAFSRLKELHPDLSLVIAGGSGWQYDPVAAEVERLGLTASVRFSGFVDEGDLPALYSAASVFAFPSLYEGFGLPVLEAMACGTPVVCSNASSLPEVAGDAALMVAPEDAQALAETLDRVLRDSSLRAGMAQRGLAQAARFTWTAAARSLLDAYRLALRD